MAVIDDGVARLPPIPDPTELTDKAIAKAVVLLEAKLDAEADLRARETTLLVTGLKELILEKFAGVQTTFDLNKVALDAAFTAQKEAVAAALTAQKEASALQNEAFVKAIDKSEAATAKTIETNQNLSRTVADGLRRDVDEVKTRTTTIESTKQGNADQRIEGRQANAAIYAAVGFGISIIVFIFFIGGIILSQRTP